MTRTHLFLAAATLSALTACRAFDRDAYSRALDGANVVIDNGPPDLGFDARMDSVDVAIPDAADASPDAGVEAGPDVLVCDPFRVPPRPGGLPDVDAGTRPPLFFAMQRVQFGLSSRSQWGTHGYDRDGLCTDPGAADGGMRPCRPLTAQGAALDGERGRDNAFASVLGTLLIASSFDENRANNSAIAGTSSIGIRITDYAGGDDGRVFVEWFPLIHGHRPGNTTALPMFDGNDVWHINSAVAYDADRSGRAAVRSEDAFVDHGQLVMRLIRGSPIRLASTINYVRLSISGGRLVGALADDGSSFGPTEFSGLWPLSEAIADVQTLGVCPPPVGMAATWNLITGALNTAADILLTEEVFPNVPCDAISLGFGVVWTRATLDPVDESTGTANENPCVDGGPGGTDAAGDARPDAAPDARPDAAPAADASAD